MANMSRNFTSLLPSNNRTDTEEQEVLYGELTFLSACFFSLVIETHILTSYLKSKPPGLTSLTDLINHDVFRVLFFASTTLIICLVVIASNVKVPLYLAFILGMSMQLLMHGVLFYLTIGAIVQFAHVHLRAVSLSETVTDETIQVRVRVFISSIAFLINIWTASDSNPAQIQYLMVVGHTEEEHLQQQISKRAFTISLALAILCAITNLALRTVVRLRKRESIAITEPKLRMESHEAETAATSSGDCHHCPNPQVESTNPMTSAVLLPFGIYVLCALVFLFALFMVFHTLDKNYFSLAPANAAVFTLSILLPGTFIVSDRKIKTFARKRAEQNLQQCLPRRLLSNRVAPA